MAYVHAYTVKYWKSNFTHCLIKTVTVCLSHVPSITAIYSPVCLISLCFYFDALFYFPCSPDQLQLAESSIELPLHLFCQPIFLEKTATYKVTQCASSNRLAKFKHSAGGYMYVLCLMERKLFSFT